MAIANKRYVSDDTMLTLIFWKNRHIQPITPLRPKAGAILRTPLEHTENQGPFHHLITMWNNANCHSGMSKTLKEIHYFFLVQGYEDIDPYIPSDSFSHQAVVLWSIINAAQHFVAGILQDSQVWSKFVKDYPLPKISKKTTSRCVAFQEP